MLRRESGDRLEVCDPGGVALGTVAGCDMPQIRRFRMFGVARAASRCECLIGFVSGGLVTFKAALVRDLLAELHHRDAFHLECVAALAFLSDEGVRVRHGAGCEA